MSDSDSGLIEFGSPRRTGDNWQYAVRPAESVDAAGIEILTEPEAAPSPSAAESPADQNREAEAAGGEAETPG